MTDVPNISSNDKQLDQHIVQPLLHAYATQTSPRLCFVLMPFRQDLDEIYHDVIKPTITKPPSNMECLRADEIYSAHEVMNDVWSAILSSRLLIADLTYRNPNVMYELGLSHAFGKKLVLLTQDINDVPFDLRHFRCIIYDRGPQGIKKLKRALTETVRSILSEPLTQSYRITTELKEAKRLRDETHRLEQQIALLQTRQLLHRRDDLQPLERLAGQASDIFVAGPTLALVAMKQDFFRQRVADGCQLRFVIPNPDPDSRAVQGLIGHWHTSPDGFLAELRSALVNLRILKQVTASAVAGSVEYRYSEFAPTLSLLMIDGESDQGYIRVELLPFNTASADRPLFVLRAAEDTYWYGYFKQRCDQLWRRALPFDVDSWTAT